MNFKLPERIVRWPSIVRRPQEQGNMYAKIVCYPPLGEQTVIPRGSKDIHFTALIEIDPSSTKNYEIVLWSNLQPGNEWFGQTFSETSEELLQTSVSTQYRRRFFHLDVAIDPTRAEDVRFTIKFRTDQDSNWKWANELLSTADGRLTYSSSVKPDHTLRDYFTDVDSDLRVKKVPSESPDTNLYSLEYDVQPARGSQCGYSRLSLGTPRHLSRWFAIVRLWSPWMAPRQGKDKFDIDKDAIMCSFQRNDGLHVVVLAISGIEGVETLLRSNDHDGKLHVQYRNDAPKINVGRILVAVSEKFDYASAAVMYHARKLVMSQVIPMSEEIQKEAVLAAERQVKENELNPQWYEEWSDGFSYCTWNGLGQDLTEDKIMRALDSLNEVNVKVTNLIIDDNWQSLDNEGQNQVYRGMTRFEANEKGFPNGMKHLVDTIKGKHGNIRHVGVWHAMLGYWGAISPNGEIAKEYKTVKAKSPSGYDWTVIAADDVGKFYDDFYRFLSNAGISSVKTDAQFQLDDLQSAPDRLELIPAFQDAWTLANLRHLSGRAISCMSQAPPLIFHSQLPTSKPRLLLRNSDDFFPDIDSSHAWHIFCNANNALLTRYLNVLPDWDMFQTIHSYAYFHAVGRCVSGGPIYFTDEPGKHDVDLINMMTAQTPRGNTVILRPSVVGHSTHPYREYGDGKLCIVATYTGAALTGTSIIGVFNASQAPITEMLSISAFPGAEQSDGNKTNPKGMYIVRSHMSGQVSKPLKAGSSKAALVVDLDVKGADVLSAHPVHIVNIASPPSSTSNASSGTVSIVNLGLVGKFTAAAAVIDCHISLEANRRVRVWTSLKALGVWGVYISDLPELSIDDDLMALLFGVPIGRHCVRRSKDDTKVLEIDVAKAWEEGEKRQKWSNEVQVELFVRV